MFTDGFLGPTLKFLDESPFSVYYRWPDKIYIWRVTHDYVESAVVFDLVKTNIQVSSPWFHINEPIYLHSILIKFRAKLVSVVQMISEDCDYNTLSNFFHEWLWKRKDVQSYPPAPENFVSISSYNILQAAYAIIHM